MRFITGFLMLFTCVLSTEMIQAQPSPYRLHDEDLLANGKKFRFWEVKQHYTKIYFVDNKASNASDENLGTEDAPFKTISKAAEVLMPGEKVIIREGIYRESVHPARGGNSPATMITYETAKGEKVIVKGSIELKGNGWKKSEGWRFFSKNELKEDTAKVWQYSFSGHEFNGYNPFGMMNILHDREWLQYKQNVKMWPHFKRRGCIYINGVPVKQVEKSTELLNEEKIATFWVEHNGMRIHVYIPDGKSPDEHSIEAAVKEQLFAPKEYGMAYINIDGIHFMHSANGFPVPQRGMVSTGRGHHWVLQNCTLEWANSVAFDGGNEMWGTTNRETGFHVIRNNIFRNCGISGIQGIAAVEMLIEDNLFENIGWQDAELAFESGGIKLHVSYNTLIRRNIFRDITFAPGIWLDYLSNKNCRVTNNLFAGITTARGAIYIEVSRNDCRVDHNVFCGLRSQYWLSGDYGAGGTALYTDGSDSIRFDHNLIFDVENSGYGSYLNATRIVDMRGGVTRWHSVTDNIFHDCGKHAIEMANSYNFSDRNLFSDVKGGYYKIGTPEPSLLLDIDAVRTLYGWEKNGLYLDHEKDDVEIIYNPYNYSISIDFQGKASSYFQNKGPFSKYDEIQNLVIDPRKKYE